MLNNFKPLSINCLTQSNLKQLYDFMDNFAETISTK